MLPLSFELLCHPACVNHCLFFCYAHCLSIVAKICNVVKKKKGHIFVLARFGSVKKKVWRVQQSSDLRMDFNPNAVAVNRAKRGSSKIWLLGSWTLFMRTKQMLSFFTFFVLLFFLSFFFSNKCCSEAGSYRGPFPCGPRPRCDSDPPRQAAACAFKHKPGCDRGTAHPRAKHCDLVGIFLPGRVIFREDVLELDRASRTIHYCLHKTSFPALRQQWLARGLRGPGTMTAAAAAVLTLELADLTKD